MGECRDAQKRASRLGDARGLRLQGVVPRGLKGVCLQEREGLGVICFVETSAPQGPCARGANACQAPIWFLPWCFA